MTKVLGPDSKYMMQWRGEWRAVMCIYDAANQPTLLVSRAAKVALFYVKDYWVACNCTPGEIITRTDRDPRARVWEIEPPTVLTTIPFVLDEPKGRA